MYREDLLNLLKKDSYRKGEYLLSSGRPSKHYINCKPVILSGEGLALASKYMLEYVNEDAAAVAGLTLGADPLVSGVALAAWSEERILNALIVRKEAKGHGTQAWIEGPLPLKGHCVTVLEDVVTTGGSSLKAVEKIRDAGYHVDRVVTIVDRQEGGVKYMKENGIELVSLFTLEDFQ